MVERLIVNRGDGGSIPPATISKLRRYIHLSYRSYEIILRQRQSKLRGINFDISKYK